MPKNHFYEVSINDPFARLRVRVTLLLFIQLTYYILLFFVCQGVLEIFSLQPVGNFTAISHSENQKIHKTIANYRKIW